MNRSQTRLRWGWLVCAVLAFGACHAMPENASAQTTISTGSIQGTILDTDGGVVTSARITITNKATGAKLTPRVTSSGTYSSGSLEPGEYLVHVEAAGFSTVELPVTVQVGNTSSGSVTLQVGSSATTITVEASAVTLNTEEATIQGVVTQQQIERLPINGRNFLDLAQLEPGVQIQDGGVFDPTKKGFSSISFAGGYGRAARIEVDGIDISDENVGTTTQNVPVAAIREFQVASSTLDVSSGLSGSGAVNIVTKSGTNALHGEGFFYDRGDGTSAAIGNPPAVFQRKQYGGNLGGPIIKDKLFLFGAWERTLQDQLSSVSLSGTPFVDFSSTFNAPFRDQQWLGRLDWQISPNVRAFYRFSFEQNKNVASFVPNTFQPFQNVDYTPVHAVGVDFVTGGFSHSVRFGSTKFRNGITNSALSGGGANPAPNVTITIGPGAFCTVGGDIFCSGPNILAPQQTYQGNRQIKYDGSKVIRTHVFRYGVEVNRILGYANADFFGLAPVANSPFPAANLTNTPFPGGAGNPLNYPVQLIVLGNGQGCFTETKTFGKPCGGLKATRLQLYVGDNWKVKPNFTATLGLRYNRDTGRTDSDVAAVDALNQFSPGLGRPVRQPNLNFGPTLGFAWNLHGDGKTVIRAGAGIYYENNVFNNILFDREGKLPNALVNGIGILCPGGSITFPGDSAPTTTINGKDIATQVCNQPIGSVANDLAALQAEFQQKTTAAGPAANGAFFGNALTASPTVNGPSFLDPNYQSQRSIQMNFGFQRQIRPGTVFSMDYVRSIGLHILEYVDENHDGDSRFLDKQGALSAIALTNAKFGCPTTSAGINCAIAARATIEDYAKAGLTSGTLSGASGFPAGAGTVAFPGVNSNFGQVAIVQPGGRSVYNGLQMSLRSDLGSPLPGIKHLNSQVSYSLSRYISPVLDSNFSAAAPNFRDPNSLTGPGGLDRTHQLSGGVIMDLPFGARLNMIGHWYSALPQNIFFAPTGNASDLLQYDFSGDGVTAAKPLQGTRLGSFGRDIKADQLNAFLTNWSSQFGNQITPAGQALVDAGLFTTDQLRSLCAVTPSLSPSANCMAEFPNLKLSLAPPGQVGNDAFFTFDVRLGWSLRPWKSHEGLRIEPQVSAFNIFNRHNYNSPLSLLRQTLDGGPGSINNTTRLNRGNDLIGLGSGVFALGAPRAMEFGLKVSF
jgi:hypothetical protein